MDYQQLPIYEVIDQLKNALVSKQNVILQAEPGAGKSTVVPLEVLKAGIFGNQKVVMLQPRRVAAKSIANFLAMQLGETVGVTVGYRIRNETKVSNHTKLEIVTEGVLTQMIQREPELSGVGLIIFDEFHERSLHADISLMLAKEVQQSLRNDLKLLIMSATIDTDVLEQYLDNTETVFVSGRVFPVDISYQGLKQKTLVAGVLSAVQELINDTSGDVLVFLPGIREINRCLDAAKAKCDLKVIEILALHGSLSLAEQQLVLKPRLLDKRRVIFSTNIAETSLTIPSITGVIDSGLERTLRFDPNSGMSRLVTRKISLASAEQRKGRAGRVRAGRCVRLWNESENISFEKYQLAEILNVDLSDVVVQLAKWGNPHFNDIDWLTKPPKAHFDSAVDLLKSLNLFTPTGTINSLGIEVSELGLPIRLAKMIAMAGNREHKNLAYRLAAIISERDFLISNDSADLMLRYDIISRSISQAEAYELGVNISAIQAVRELERTIKQRVNNVIFSKSSSALLNQNNIAAVVACLVLFAYPDRLAVKRANNSNRYQLSNGKGVKIREHDSLCKHKLLVVANCDLREREGLVFSAIPIELEIIKAVFNDNLMIAKINLFETDTGRFFSEKTLNYGSIKLERLGKGVADKTFINNKIRELIADRGEVLFNWTKSCESWVKRLLWLGSVNNDFPTFSKQTIFEKADMWLIPYIGRIKRLQDLKSVDIFPLIKSLVSWEEQSTLDREAPEHYVAPSGRVVKIDYDSFQGPKVSIVLQEMFGELRSPILAGKVSLRFELLSPANRPIQITSDIGQFWHSSYIEVAKDMRSKYPKHRWPTEPLLEKAGKSIKLRS